MPQSPDTQKRSRLQRRQQGLCVYGACPNPAEANRTMCQKHLDRRAATASEVRVAIIATGICPQCRKQPLATGHTLCPGCLHKLNTRFRDLARYRDGSKHWRQTMLAQGLCSRCGKRPTRPDRVNCVECATDQAAAARDRWARRRDQRQA